MTHFAVTPFFIIISETFTQQKRLNNIILLNLYYLFIAHLISKIPSVPQINTPRPSIDVRTQLFPQLIMTVHKQLKEIINAPYFACLSFNLDKKLFFFNIPHPNFQSVSCGWTSSTCHLLIIPTISYSWPLI